jgi:hypothetical protein
LIDLSAAALAVVCDAETKLKQANWGKTKNWLDWIVTLSGKPNLAFHLIARRDDDI